MCVPGLRARGSYEGCAQKDHIAYWCVMCLSDCCIPAPHRSLPAVRGKHSFAYWNHFESTHCPNETPLGEATLTPPLVKAALVSSNGPKQRGRHALCLSCPEPGFDEKRTGLFWETRSFPLISWPLCSRQEYLCLGIVAIHFSVSE